MSTGPGRDAAGRVELRVHGIGDHGPLSALGSSRPAHYGPADPDAGAQLSEAARARPHVEPFLPPDLPDHPLELLNWSRASRRFAGFLWYLALPFTLANVAGFMAPAGRGRRRAFLAATALGGLVLTIATCTWMLVILETIAKRLPWVTQVDQVAVLFGLAGLLTALAIVWRARAADRIPPGPWRTLAYAHAGVVALLTAYVILARPASGATSWAGLPDACTPAPVGSCGIPPAPDVASIIVIASTLATVLLGGLAWACCAGTPDGAARRAVAQGPGSALAMVLALLVVHASGSSLRLAVDWLLVYVTSFGQRTTVLPSRVLLVRDESRVPVYLLDTVASYALTCMAIALLSVYVLSVMSAGGASAGGAPPKVRRATRRHQAVVGLPRGLPRGIAVALPLTVLAAVVIYSFVFDHSEHTGDLLYAAVVIATHAAAAVAAAFLLVGRRSPAIRKVLGTVADVLGFWDVRTHPLAGRSYRREIAEGLTREVDRHGAHSDARVSLVGHSQGSVLCAWVASERARANAPWPRVQLVTCGSPLSSLYATFFPMTFDASFFLRARSAVGQWDNYWRNTDPIATSLPVPEEDGSAPPAPPQIRNVRLDDPEAENVHSDYWLEPHLTASVTTWLQGSGVLAPDGGAPPEEARGGGVREGASVALPELARGPEGGHQLERDVLPRLDLNQKPCD